MNADSFVKYLKDPLFLHQISYQELKTLSLQYPYCQNLHLLLLKKSLLDNHQDQEQNLERAAASSVDRTHLFHQLKAIDASLVAEDSFLLSDEYLELKDLNQAGPSMEMLEAEAEKEAQKVLELENIPAPAGPPEEILLFEDDSFSEEDFQFPPELVDLAPAQEVHAYYLGDDTISTLAAFAGILPELKVQKSKPSRSKKRLASRKPVLTSRPLLHKLKQLDAQHRGQISPSAAPPAAPSKRKPRPQPKKSFNSWLEQFQEPAIKSQLDEIMEHKKLEEVKKESKKIKKRKHQMLQIAIKSITENQEVASETLAELLVRQGRYDKAIEMYKRLLLLFPEKSDYFASKIDNLKSI
jgi:tetratricopeptide (TPR) repeat protein